MSPSQPTWIALALAGGLLLTGCGASSTSKPSTQSTANSSTSFGAALVSRGHELYTADACAGCHSLTGQRLTGPPFKGLAGSPVPLDTGQVVTATSDYLVRSIIAPDAQTVRGFPAGLMAQAIASADLAHKPDDVRALVAFIESVK